VAAAPTSHCSPPARASTPRSSARTWPKLRDLGLIFSHRAGKEIWYEPAAGRVRYERHEDGSFSLTVTGRGGGVAVTVAVGVAGVSDRAT
jgi:hypothetical protein